MSELYQNSYQAITSLPRAGSAPRPSARGLAGRVGIAGLLASALLGCVETPVSTSVARIPSGEATHWDMPAELPPCRADESAALLDSALARHGLSRSRLGIAAGDLHASGYQRAGVLDDPFRLSWFQEVHARPSRLGCFEGAVTLPLDGALDTRHPVAGIIRHAAVLLDRPPDDRPPFVADNLPGTYREAVEHLCRLAEHGEVGCETPRGALPADLSKALAPILWAIAEGVEAQLALYRATGTGPEAAPGLHRLGGNFLHPPIDRVYPDLRAAFTRNFYLAGNERARLYRAASQIAFAVEDTDWGPFEGRRGIEYHQDTPWGRITVHDGAVHVYPPDDTPMMLLVDLGGDDRHYGQVASNGIANPVSIAVDLGGADVYRYPEPGASHDARLLPADGFGRYHGDELAGPFSLSHASRQGGARNGIAMLFDLGVADDHYQSLRASQGYAHLGVGVLFDQGGDDRYLSEAVSQGAALFGIGLAIDAGKGRDLRRAYAYSQGYAYVAGFGLLLDGGGDDIYQCEHGDAEEGGLYVYPNSQLRGKANLSFCQGAAQGRRHDDHGVFLSGGLGVLRDRGGDDHYEASLFSQGSGYWQAFGMLSDGGGSDRYDAYYYAQGGAAHYAVGLLSDDGPEGDRFNMTRPPRFMQLGAGHDFSVGALINEGGDDVYRFAGLAAGASNCNGVGVFIDNGGDDRYLALSDYGSGMGNVSEECLEGRPDAVSIGVMIDAGGRDRYEYPDMAAPAPGEGSSWGQRRRNLPSEYGIGVDGEGDTGIHSGG